MVQSIVIPETHPDTEREMILLEHIENDPDVTQAGLAAQLGVAVGTVNWHIKRLIAKGYVKVKRAQRRKLRYIITPEGLALRARLTVNYIETSMRLYRRIRERVREQLIEARKTGYDQVFIEVSESNGDIIDICRLTCLEQDMKIVNPEARSASNPVGGSTLPPDVAILEVHGMKVFLRKV